MGTYLDNKEMGLFVTYAPFIKFLHIQLHSEHYLIPINSYLWLKNLNIEVF